MPCFAHTWNIDFFGLTVPPATPLPARAENAPAAPADGSLAPVAHGSRGFFIYRMVPGAALALLFLTLAICLLSAYYWLRVGSHFSTSAISQFC
jgi:hypothetical protein